MAKKEKSIEKMRKGYKRRGIFYIVAVILLIAATITVNINSVNHAIYLAVYPKNIEMNLFEGEKTTVYSEQEVIDGMDYASFYYLDEDGNQQSLPSGSVNGSNGTVLISTSFKMRADFRINIIKGVIKALLVLFIILFAIYLLRFSYYLSNKDEEWKKQAGDKVTDIRVKFDKLSTNIGSKLQKKNKK